MAWLVSRRSRTETYRPGEQHDAITRSLSQQLPEGAPRPELVDVTAEAGLGAFRTFNGPRSSQLPEDMGSGAAWGDYDNDGWLDLALTGYRSLLLFHNEQGRLVRAEEALPAPDGFWAGVSWADYDRDRDLDLYVCGYVRYSEDAKGRGRSSEQFGTMVPYTLNPASYAPERNLLFRNDGGGAFTEVAEQLGVANPEGRSLTGLWHDLDADGWLDLVIANGSTVETGDAPKRLEPQPPFLFWNRGDFFHDLAPLNEVLARPRVARGLAVSDYDNDGDLDILLVDLERGVLLLRNDMRTGNWLELRLRSRLPGNGTTSGFADGAQVIARAGDVVLRRTVSSGSYLSQSTRTVHLGLGKATQLDSVEVRWLGGSTETYAELAAGSIWELREGDPVAHRVPSPGSVATSRDRAAEFWPKQRAAMRAMKRDGDLARAIELFREALAVDPLHEEARYYLASCLADQGRSAEALDELRELLRVAPRSQRALKQWGTLKAYHCPWPGRPGGGAGEPGAGAGRQPGGDGDAAGAGGAGRPQRRGRACPAASRVGLSHEPEGRGRLLPACLPGLEARGRGAYAGAAGGRQRGPRRGVEARGSHGRRGCDHPHVPGADATVALLDGVGRRVRCRTRLRAPGGVPEAPLLAR